MFRLDITKVHSATINRSFTSLNGICTSSVSHLPISLVDALFPLRDFDILLSDGSLFFPKKITSRSQWHIYNHPPSWSLVAMQKPSSPQSSRCDCAEIHAARADKLDQSEKRIVEKTGSWLAESLNEPISESHGVKHGLWNKQTLSISNLHFDKTGRWKCLLDRL